MTRSEAGKLGWIKSVKYREEKKKKIRADYYKTPKKCKNCGSVIGFDKRENLFCSQSCNATFNNKKRDRRVLKKCLYCKEEKLFNKNGKFCSIKCSSEYRKEKKDNDVLKNGCFDKSNHHSFKRKFLEKQNGHRCFVCNTETWNGKPIPLEVEHKNGNPYDDRLENVDLICPNCHAQTDTYKGKNKGHGRHERMKRYKEGKSF